MQNIAKNKAAIAALATLPFFVAGLMVGVHMAFAHEGNGEDHAHEVAISATASATVNADANASSSVREAFKEMKDKALEIRSVQKDSATTSDGNVGLRANLNAKRVAALAELKKDGLTFMVRMKAWQGKLASSTNELRIRLQGEKRTSVDKILGGILSRFTFIANQLSSVSTRLAARIDALEDKGFDMDESTDLLADADAKLTIAKDDIASASTTVHASLNASTTKSELKSAVETAKESLKEAYKGYKDVIKSINAEVRVHASTSASTTSN